MTVECWDGPGFPAASTKVTKCRVKKQLTQQQKSFRAMVNLRKLRSTMTPADAKAASIRTTPGVAP